MKDKFTKRFPQYLAAYWSIIGSAYLLLLLFIEVPDNNTRFVDTTIGFLLGTVIGGIITFFYGSSQESSDKNELLTQKKNENP